jgi:hypothetical protein
MRNLSRVTLIINLGKNPEIQTLEGCKKVPLGEKRYLTEIIADSIIILDKPQ